MNNFLVKSEGDSRYSLFNIHYSIFHWSQFTFAESGHSGLVEGVLRFHDAVVVAFAEKSVGDECLKLEVCEVVVETDNVGVLELWEGISHNTFRCSVGNKGGVDAKCVIIIEVGVESGNCGVGAMRVGPFDGELGKEAFATAFLVEFGGGGCVERDEDVGHDAAAPIDGTACGGVELEGVGEVDGVGGEHFAMFVSVAQLVVVVGVGFLYAAPRGGVVACSGETDLCAVLKGEECLHQSFAIAAAAYDGAAVPVLDGAADDFGG